MPIALISPATPSSDHIRLCEQHGFDRILLPTGFRPDAITGRLGFLAERPVMLAPQGNTDARLAYYEAVNADGLGRYDADLLLVPGGSLRQVTGTVRAARRAAAHLGHYPAFLLAVTPIVGATAQAAQEHLQALSPVPPAEEGITLAGTPEQIARSIMDFYDIGIDHILLRGTDLVEQGRDLIPLLRRKVALRDGMLAMLAG